MRCLQLNQAIAILALTSYRTVEDLKSAFRSLAHRYHPDKNPGRDTSAKFRELMRAYQYCLEHLDELSLHFLAPPPPLNFKTDLAIGNMDDIFADIFGIGGQGRLCGFLPAETVTLKLADFARGGDKILRVTAYTACARCHGGGVEPGGSSRLCRQCFGFGASQRRVGGVEKSQTCPACLGRGREMDLPCRACDGYGVTPRRGRYRLRLPLGISPLCRYTVAVFDRAGRPQGHAVIMPRPLPDKIFQIESCELLCDYYADYARRSVILTTPYGDVSVDIPLTAHDGFKLRIPGAGLPTGERNSRGDLVVTILRHRDSLWRRLRKFLWEDD